MTDQPTNESFQERARARSEAKNQAVRESLEPLAPGERPRAVTIASIVAGVMAITNLVAFIATGDTSGDDAGGQILQTIIICAILGAASVGMWFAKYWAVLGFQTVLGLQIIVLSLALTRVESPWVALLFLAIIGASGTLFWFLIRAMARIQMPESPTVKSLREQREEAEAAAAAEQEDERG